MTMPGRLAVPLLLILAVAAACGSPTVSPPPAPSTPAPSPGASLDSTASPTASPVPSAGAAATPPGAPSPNPAETPATAASPTAAPSPVAAGGPTAADFWALVARGVTAAKRLEIDIAGPNVATMRFEVDASATVIDSVIGFVCVDGRAYDGQSAFTAVPGRWSCGVPALVAGFRHIGQPIDAWNANVPSDSARHEAVTVAGSTWTWTYRATSPYLGGKVTATVTLDRASRRITSARREDPTGPTRYTFHYAASFPPIAVPR